MGYIEQNLMEGEVVVYRARLHYLVYWKACLLIVLALLLFALPVKHEVYGYQAIVAGVLLLVGLLNIVYTHGNRQYILTNKRLIEKMGIIRRESSEILLRKCDGVRISQSIFGRLFGYGTVVVKTTGESANDYHFIASPIKFSMLINQQIDRLRDDS